MPRAIPANERQQYIAAIIRITQHCGRLTVSEAMKKLDLSRDTTQRYFREAAASGDVYRHGRLGLFRSERAALDFDMKRYGMVPKASVASINPSLLCSPVFQRFLDVQEAIHGQ